MANMIIKTLKHVGLMYQPIGQLLAGMHLGMLHFQSIITTRARYPDLDITQIDSLSVFLADLRADIYIF